MRTVVISLLDKSWPPAHSFVDGMLSGVAGKEPDISVRLITSSTEHSGRGARRYGRAVCAPILLPRRGLYRFMNFFLALLFLIKTIKKLKIRGVRVVLFVRNDPICLLACCLMRSEANRLVYQSSFPHELYNGGKLRLWLVNKIYSLCRKVDVVTGVSPEGVIRAARLCKGSEAGPYIPLLLDSSFISSVTDSAERKREGYIPTFVYIGAHGERRQLDKVLTAIINCLNQGVKAKFQFIGGTTDDTARLMKTSGLSKWVESGDISFSSEVPREAISDILTAADVGICLIPPEDIYYESSPTKLAEYMGAGLAILASTGIPLQEKWVKESKSGVLVDWRVDSISYGIKTLARNNEDRESFQESGLRYVRSNLMYDNFICEFRTLIHA